MKLLLPSLLICLNSFCQINSDDSDYDIGTTESNSTSEIHYNPVFRPLVNNVSLCDSGSAELISNSCYPSSFWSTDSAGTNILSTVDTFITPVLYNDTSFYLTTITGGGNDLIAPMPAQTSTYSGNVRGYYFTAPLDMTITGFWVPTTASSSSQNVEIVRFNSGPPPLYSATTNDFISLGYWNNYSAIDTITTSISISAGDIIGIYGNRGDINSYASTPTSTTIGCETVALTRSGMQQSLSTNQMSNVYSQVTAEISRIEFIYDLADSTTELVNVTIGSVTASTQTLYGCDSMMINGTNYYTSQVIIDTLFGASAEGCDSIVTTNLLIGSINYNQTFTGCDSLLFDNIMYYSSQTLYDTLIGASVGGCDSVVITNLQVNNSLSVTNNITINGGEMITVGVNTYSISGTYEDSLLTSSGCDSLTTTNLTVLDNVGFNDKLANGLKLFPNPVKNIMVINSEISKIDYLDVTDIQGKKLISISEINTHQKEVNISYLSEGVYFVRINLLNGEKSTIKVVKTK